MAAQRKTRRSCENAVCGWLRVRPPSRARCSRSRRSPRDAAALGPPGRSRRRCAHRSLDNRGARAHERARTRAPRVAPRERDPEGGERLFRFRARPDPAEAVSFIDAHRDRFGVEPICRTLGLAPSTYDARRTRPPSRRALEDAVLLERIRAVYERNYGSYGSRRVWK